LQTCAAPKIFVQSTHDQYAPREEFERVYAEFAEPKRVVWIEAADHFFAGALQRVEEAAGSAIL
jgi:alpha/beta superfamily hydrolase